MKQIIVDETNRKKRVDILVGEHLNELSRSYISRLINEQRILVNDEPTKPGYRLRLNDKLDINFDQSELQQIPSIDLPVIYEDSDVIVVNKPSGVISHSRGKYWDEPSVASFIRQKIRGLEGERAGIVHRLDRATSGVMVCARNQAALSFLQKQFADRTIEKTYIALCQGGEFELAHATIDAPIGRNPKKPTTFMVRSDGKPAQTTYTILKFKDDNSLVELKPQTGRTHQLRVHTAYIGHPIVGDVFYGPENQTERLMLHAKSLKVRLPSGEEKIFSADLPEEFAKYA